MILNSLVFSIIAFINAKQGNGSYYLPILLVLISFMFFDEFSRWTRDFFTAYPSLTYLFTFAWFLIIPAFYLFVRDLLSEKIRWIDILHIIPLILANTLQKNMFALSDRAKIDSLTSNLKIAEPHLSKLIFSLQIIVYLILIYRLLKTKFNLSGIDLFRSMSTWVKGFYLLLVVYLIFVIVVIVAFELFDSYLIEIDIGKSFLFVIPVYGWFVYTIYQPQALNFPVRSIRVWMDKWQLDQLSGDLKHTIKRIRELGLHTKKDIQLPELAISLKKSGRELSRSIKNELGISCIQLINLLRIQEMEVRYSNPTYANFTLLGLAQEVGFRSKSTLYRSFKDFTGHSPSEYFEKHTTNKTDNRKFS